MGFIKRFRSSEKQPSAAQNGPTAAAIAEQKITAIAIFLGAVASIGGFMFGYVRCALMTPLTAGHALGTAC